MPAEQPDGLLADLVVLAVDAGKEILRFHGGDVAVETKGDDLPVTAADRAAEAVILAGLARLAPEIPVIAEEEVSAGRVPETGARFFLVDPLDGTREFIGGRGEFTVNIALVEDGVPTIGVVYAPALGTVCAGGPEGAFEATVTDGAAAGWRRISARHRRQPPVAVASRSHRDAETDRFLADNGVAETRSAGSSIKFCLIARGEADVYPRFGRTMEWDTAAGDAVLRAAGGHVETVGGEPLRYGKRERGYDNPGFIAWAAPPA